jgi:hypothetical protein
MTEASEPRHLELFSQWLPSAEVDSKAFYSFADNSGGVAIARSIAPGRSRSADPTMRDVCHNLG